MEPLTRLGNINSRNLLELQHLCLEYQRWMFPSNKYAPQRYEVHILPHSVKALSERWCICFFYLKTKYLEEKQ